MLQTEGPHRGSRKAGAEADQQAQTMLLRAFMPPSSTYFGTPTRRRQGFTGGFGDSIFLGLMLSVRFSGLGQKMPPIQLGYIIM